MHRSPNRVVARVAGAFYLLVGAALSVVLAAGAPITDDGLAFGVFQVNVAQNVVHLVLGIALLALSARPLPAVRRCNPVFGTVFLVLGLAGVFLAGTDGNVLALNGAGNALHFATAVVLLAVGLGAEKPSAVTTA